ncbi:hypothetical protein GPA_24370 [Gordonibacter pamelaeae 7-10-1-b]|uniref:Uncharacterized protein n=1 Tax=Gordonibacter pamelaeae 7-10-1-b TaxID=657308 RepID=D6EA51_9ACTN|nr:hypothetical protein GPA_24370 [Gordonibacter pamelaeae 7-10-1-b]
MGTVNGTMPNSPWNSVAPSTVPPTTTTRSALRMGVNGTDSRTMSMTPTQATRSTHSVDTWP